MIPYLYSSILWGCLIALDLVIARRLFVLYREDLDLRKLMFTIGLLMCTPIYAVAIIGINSSTLANNVFGWSVIPIFLAFLFDLLNQIVHLNLRKFYNVFLAGTIVTIALYFFAPPNAFWPFILAGFVFAAVLAVAQYSRKFDLSSAILFLSMPSFVVALGGLSLDMVELALFAAFGAKIVLLLAFETSKREVGESSSLLVLRKKLGAAEDNFSKLFSLLPDPAVIVDDKGAFLAVSSKVSAITGYQQEELLGNNFLNSDLVTSSSKALMAKNLARRMQGFPVAPYDVELQSKDGRPLQFEVNASKIDHQGTPANLVIFRDLSERNKLLKSLRDEEERFQDVAQSTGDWVWEVDTEGKYVYSNPVVQKLLGYTVPEIIGKGFSDLLPPEDKDKVGDLFDSFAGNGPQRTKRCLHKDGSVSVMETRGVPVYGAGGRLMGYRGVDRDVTEKVEMEERLLKSERFAAIGELAAMVAHDLRNPLQGIANAAFYVKRSSTVGEKEREMLTVIQDDVKYSDKIVRDLLDYSRNIRLERTETNPRLLMEEALSMAAVPERVTVRNETQATPTLRLDVGRMKQVFVNIINNAADAMPGGGSLLIRSREADHQVEFTLADSGMGMTKEVLGRIFTPLFTTKAKGMGFGLSICRRIVEAHGGRISAASVPGKGTTFTISLPMDQGNDKKKGDDRS
ncbi:MAG: PAS domain S-box protein [Nitrososphaerales archaeon]|jgi:PAS domain S-box-containing protein